MAPQAGETLEYLRGFGGSREGSGRTSVFRKPPRGNWEWGLQSAENAREHSGWERRIPDGAAALRRGGGGSGRRLSRPPREASRATQTFWKVLLDRVPGSRLKERERAHRRGAMNARAPGASGRMPGPGPGIHFPKHVLRCLLAAAGNDFSSEALPGALPVGQNNPRVRRPPFPLTRLPTCHRGSCHRLPYRGLALHAMLGRAPL